MRREFTDCNVCPTRLNCVTSRIGPQELAGLQPAIRRRRVHPGEPLDAEGEVAGTVRIIQMGSAFAYRLGVDGRTRAIGAAGRGAALGLFGVFGQPTQASFVSASDARICEIPVPLLAQLAARDPAYSHYLAKTAADACGKMASWSEAMRLRGVTNQLAYSLLLLAQEQQANAIELPTNIGLAELLGTTRESVARSLRALEQEGGIERGSRRHCEVHREKLLERLGRPAD
jgi:CRP-like cAMP-binding protein